MIDRMKSRPASAKSPDILDLSRDRAARMEESFNILLFLGGEMEILTPLSYLYGKYGAAAKRRAAFIRQKRRKSVGVVNKAAHQHRMIKLLSLKKKGNKC